MLPTKKDKPRLYYGYVVLLAAVCIITILTAGATSFGVFFKPMVADFGWSRGATSGVYTTFMIVHGLLFIVTGRLTDRFGPRMIVTVCSLLFGLGYLLISQISALWHIYLLYGVLAGVGMAGGFVPLASTLARWFTKNLGLITGILTAGSGIGTMIGPSVATRLVLGYGWRSAYLIMGIAAVVLLLLAAQFVKRNKEGNESLQYSHKVRPEDSGEEVAGLSLREAVRTRQFWMLCVAYLIWGLSVHTILVHIVPHITDMGFSAVVGANAMIAIGAANIAGRIWNR